VRYARQDTVVGRCLVIIFVFSLLSLPFITQLPTIADENLGIAPKSVTYGLLYGAFGMGAVVGALSIGTVFAGSSKARLTRYGLLAFAGFLTLFAVLGAPAPSFPTIFGLGAVYFAVITSLSTVLQQDLDDSVRGKVMALWIMGFGGTVPIGGLLGGLISEQLNITPVMLGGAAVAVGLAAYARLEREPALSPQVAAAD
jgi:predicted MFS family arabinose efflux permease